MSNFREEINKHGKIIYTNVGCSMMPLIQQGRDVLIIEKPTGKLKKYDIPLYQRNDGKYVLHRILQVRKNDYGICGDNCYRMEYGITDQQIIGVLTAIIRNGKAISFQSFRYQLYVHIWCDFFPVRALILRSKAYIKRHWK